MEIKLIREKIAIDELKKMAKDGFGDMVKAVVDVGREMMAVGGELHSDANDVILENGSSQQDVWGINIYPEKIKDEWIEFHSLINIRPSVGNRSRGVENEAIREKIKKIVDKLVQ